MRKRAGKLSHLFDLINRVLRKQQDIVPMKETAMKVVTPARAKAMKLYGALSKASQEDYPELGRRGVGQRFFEGSMSGAGKGLTAGALVGALLGGLHGYQSTKQEDLKEQLKAILMGAAEGGLYGGAMGTAVGGGLGAAGSTLFGSRRQKLTY